MTIYNINLAIGWASSGVEYAQVYRSKLFEALGINSKFVFCDTMTQDHILELTRNIGLKSNDIISMPAFLGDVKLTYPTLTEKTIKAYYGCKHAHVEHIDDTKFKLELSDNAYYMAYYSRNSKRVYAVEIVVNNYLIRKDYFNGKSVLFSEYYTPRHNKAERISREWFNTNGDLYLYESTNNDKTHYIYQGSTPLTKDELTALFIQKLNLSNHDLIILDRATTTGQAVYQYKNNAKLAIVVHAEHWTKHGTTDDYILWNNYYDYQFEHHEQTNVYICATETQRQQLIQDFKNYNNIDLSHKITTIPVGFLDELKYNPNRKPFSAVTASRLADEKHIDILIDMAKRVHAKIPEFTLDIYGEGVNHDNLKAKIGSDNYIQLKGHHDMTDVYKDYSIYVSASGSEGFGLSLMEAVGSGLPIIGYNVPYGNQTFASKEHLLESPANWSNADIDTYASKVINVLTTKNDDKQPYNIAEAYLKDAVASNWKRLLERFNIAK